MEHPEKPYSTLYEDEEILVVDKLSPLPVQSEKSGDRSLQEMLKEELGSRGLPSFVEAVHRIDRRASGIVLFARSHKSLSTLAAAFRDRRIDKIYIACVEREPEPAEGRLLHRLVWDKRRNLVHALPLGPSDGRTGGSRQDSAAAGPPARRGGRGPRSAGEAESRPGESAELEYRLLGRSERYFFVEVRLITGRHHQIRAQFAAAGLPIRGDLKYGARRSTANGLIMLHARKTGFDQPRSGERIELLAPFPETESLWEQCPPEA